MINASNAVITDTDIHNYTHPIPNRNFIIDLLKKGGKPLSKDQLARFMNLSEDAELEGLRRRLRAMERDGQLIFERDHG